MKKILISCLAIFLLAGCDRQKEYPDIAKKIDRIDSVLAKQQNAFADLPIPFHISLRLRPIQPGPKIRLYSVEGSSPLPMGLLVYKLMSSNLIFVGDYKPPTNGYIDTVIQDVGVNDQLLMLPYYSDFFGCGFGTESRSIPTGWTKQYQFKVDGTGGASSIMVSTMGLVP